MHWIIVIVFASRRLSRRSGAKRAQRKSGSVQQQVGIQQTRIQREVRRQRQQSTRRRQRSTRERKHALRRRRRTGGEDWGGRGARGEYGAARGASSAKSGSWLRSAWLSSQAQAEGTRRGHGQAPLLASPPVALANPSSPTRGSTPPHSDQRIAARTVVEQSLLRRVRPILELTT
ncbi:hypothetical protein PC128_g24320 [Phytophthora cactorum]|nr:hypothetical protein PC128_g24320 [Phytophthora cactorum]